MKKREKINKGGERERERERERDRERERLTFILSPCH